jgi:predicted RecB family nuclease
LNINRQNTYLIRPNFINYERKNWNNIPKDTVEFYLDFETLNSNFGSIIKDGIISYDSNQFIFMIGVGFAKNSQWIFKTFLMKSKTTDAEFIMFKDFMDYIKSVLKTEKKSHAKMYHWSFAEVGAYNSFKSRHSNNRISDSHISFYDLNKVFINEPVTVHGALDFSLKSVAKALNKHKLIESVWDTSSPCSNGLNAMILANNLYEKNPSDIDQEPIMKEIIYYNEIDCRVMWEIHNLIRENNLKFDLEH